jgi:tetratricopeptide (TPR) repeat protein
MNTRHILLALLLPAALAVAQATDWYARGQADFAAGDMRSAKAAFEQAVLDAKDRPFHQAAALAGLGQTMLALRESSNALAALRQAAELAPEQPHVLHLLGQALYKTGDREEAAATMQAALDLSENEPALAAVIRNDLAVLSKIEPAALAQAIEAAEPGQARARMLTNLGIHLWNEGDKAAAADHLRQALADMEAAVGPEHPDVAFILENYAIVLAATGQPNAAKAASSRARDLKAAFAWQANTLGAAVDVNDLRRDR